MRDFPKLKDIRSLHNQLAIHWLEPGVTTTFFFFFFFVHVCVMGLMSAIGPEMTGDG